MKLSRTLGAFLLLAATGCAPDIIAPGGTGTFEVDLTTATTAEVKGSAVYTATVGLTVVMSNTSGFRLSMIRTGCCLEPGSFLVNSGSAHFDGIVTIRVDGQDWDYRFETGNVIITRASLGRAAGSLDVTAVPVATGSPHASIRVVGTFNAGCSSSCFIT